MYSVTAGMLWVERIHYRWFPFLQAKALAHEDGESANDDLWPAEIW